MRFQLRTVLPASLLFCTVLSFELPSARAQSSLDEVHIGARAPVGDGSRATHAGSAMARDYTDGGNLIRTSVHMVLVPVNIVDTLNRPVVGLQQTNFELYEGKKPQQIKHFSNEDTPVSVGIIVDTSGSMGDKLEQARDAIRQFCETSNPQDEFFLITFSDAPLVAKDFTTNPADIENELLLARPRGQTSLLDAVYLGLRQMREAHYGRKALLILSDGGDNHSRFSEHDVKAAIKEADVMIYAVGIFDRYVRTQEELLGPDLLRNISEVTGGQAFTLSSPTDLVEVTQRIGAQLRHQYVLAYQPQLDPHDKKWHKISVKLKISKGLPFLRVQARTGYYGNEE